MPIRNCGTSWAFSSISPPIPVENERIRFSIARRRRGVACDTFPSTYNPVAELDFHAVDGLRASLPSCETIRLRKAFTQIYEYPERPVPVKARYRGFHRFDLTTCIGCEKCAVACPVDCIYIEKVKSPAGKGFRIDGFAVDYTKCMFCALCVDPCPVDCIFMGSNHDLSCYSRDGCIVDYAKLPLEVSWGQSTLNPTAVSESKVLYEPVWVKGEASPFEVATEEK
jgi:NADH-quinone oxidoreductase subunit I